METDEGKEIYRWRKIIVEPVIGQIKENLGFRQFSLRGIEGARIEMNLASISHNLKKIWKIKGDISEKGMFYFEIEVIVRRALLFNSPENLQGLIFSATMPKAKNQSREPY
jgi:hypothetical protein